MGLNDVSRTIERNIVEDTNGWGEDIIFTPTLTGIPIQVRAMPLTLRHDHYNEKSKTYEDRFAFLSVFLDVRPVRGDRIEYDGFVYLVEDMEGTLPYDIFCRVNARHSAGRSGRKEI